MDKTTVLISLTKDELQNLIIDCVNSCLKYHKPTTQTTSQPYDELLTVKQTAKFLNLAVPTIYGMVNRNELPFMKKSKRLYFSKQELMEYIKEGRQKTVGEINKT